MLPSTAAEEEKEMATMFSSGSRQTRPSRIIMM